jgi:hypothetical protein
VPAQVRLAAQPPNLLEHPVTVVAPPAIPATIKNDEKPFETMIDS